MGCDIHVAVEMNYSGSPWFYEFSPNILRDYRLFAKLADVRNVNNAVVPISLPRGFPPDICSQTREYLEFSGDHSASWISEEEFLFHFPWCSMFNQHSAWTLAGYYALSIARGYGGKFRFVFNFDN